MAKKFGKFLLATAAVGTAVAAAAYYYMQKKDSVNTVSDDSDEDFDDFSEDFEDEETSARTYVSLNPTTGVEEDATEDTASEGDFTPLAEQLTKQAEETVEEAVEEFFDEEDDSDSEPPILDN